MSALNSSRISKIAVSTIVALVLLHLLFINDTLRNAYHDQFDDEVAVEIEVPQPAAGTGSDTAVKPADALAPTVDDKHAPQANSELEASLSQDFASTTTTSTGAVVASSSTSSLPYLPTPSAISPFSEGDTEEYLAICLVTKNQYPDLTEWLVHHYHHHAIRRFYIMDDGSSPILATYNYSSFIDPAAITHRYYAPELPRVDVQQQVYYDECMRLFGTKHKWMAFIDTDEFIEVKNGETIHGILKDFEKDDKVGGLGINWQIHTSGGLLKRPESARKTFTTCIQDIETKPYPEQGLKNQHIKSIVRTSKYKAIRTPHEVEVVDGAVVVGEHGDVITRGSWRIPTTRARISIHHYASKSKEEFEAKINRGNAMATPKSWEWWDDIEKYPQMECKEMASYEP